MCEIIYRGHIIYMLHYLLHIIIIQKQQLNVWRRGIKKEISFFIKSYIYSTADNSENII